MSTLRTESDARVITFCIVDPEPFDLPTWGHFGGSRGDEDADMEPHRFTPHLVKVWIESGKVVNMGAFAEGGFATWYLMTDACQDNRNVYQAGVAHLHWPTWLDQLVSEKLTKLYVNRGL